MSKQCLLIIAIALLGCENRLVPHYAFLGKWKSNEKLTLASMNRAKDVTPEARALFENDFFGHLVIEHKEHESRATNEKDDYDSGFEPYEVVEVTDKYIRIKEWSELLQQFDETTLYLEGDCYYVITSKYEFREYFCKYGE